MLWLVTVSVIVLSETHPTGRVRLFDRLVVWLRVSTATGRRSAPPLNLTGLPGTEKLNEREKEVRESPGSPVLLRGPDGGCCSLAVINEQLFRVEQSAGCLSSLDFPSLVRRLNYRPACLSNPHY